jgi:hypothetical protein
MEEADSRPNDAARRGDAAQPPAAGAEFPKIERLKLEICCQLRISPSVGPWLAVPVNP